MKWKVRRQRGGSGDKRVDSEEASLWRPFGGPPCSPPLCHPVAEGQMVSMWWMASGGPLEGRCCYVCRDCGDIEIFGTQDEFFFGTEPFDKVYPYDRDPGVRHINKLSTS